MPRDWRYRLTLRMNWRAAASISPVGGAVSSNRQVNPLAHGETVALDRIARVSRR